MPSSRLLRIIKAQGSAERAAGKGGVKAALTPLLPPPWQVGMVTLRLERVGRETWAHPAGMDDPRLIRTGSRSEALGEGAALTGDADVGAAALGGARRAPGHALAPIILQAKELLHLLPGHLNLHLPHQQPCRGTRHGITRMGRSGQEQGN